MGAFYVWGFEKVGSWKLEVGMTCLGQYRRSDRDSWKREVIYKTRS